MARDTSLTTAVSVAEAQARVLDTAPPTETVDVTLDAALGCVLAGETRAKWALPNAAVSVMDGYAVAHEDLAAGVRTFHLVGESAAGHPVSETLARHTAVRISTGAVVPPGADTVITQEDTSRDASSVTIDEASVGGYHRGRFVRAAGSDVREHTPLLGAGTWLGPGELALLAGTGHTTCTVYPRPRVSILCTGDELVPPGSIPRPGQVINTNANMLAAQVRASGGIHEIFDIARDTEPDLAPLLEQAVLADLLITSGGISVGDHDLVYAALMRLGLQVGFSAVRLRPGKPTTFGRVGQCAVLALPGNPASSYVTFELFARPWIRRRRGLPSPAWHRPTRRVTLDTPTEPGGKRAHFVRAIVRGDRAYPLPDQTSGALRSIAGHNALVVIPEGVSSANAGDSFDAWLLDDVSCPDPMFGALP